MTSNKSQTANYLKEIGILHTLSSQPINRMKTSQFTAIEDLERFYLNELEHPLKKTALNCVFSNKSSARDIMFVGEAPGADEDEQGEPFVGRSGQLLNLILESINLSREKVYITNLVPFRPPMNRNPSTEEMNFFRPYLNTHIQLINPKCIILLGGIVTKALFGENVKISQFRGKWHDLIINETTYPILPTFHPSYLLRSPRQKKLSWLDMLLVKKYLKI